MSELSLFIGLGGVPLVVALTQLVKRTIPDLPSRYYALVSVLWGIAVNVALADLAGSRLGPAAMVGVITGLTASGLYSASRSIVSKSS